MTKTRLIENWNEGKDRHQCIPSHLLHKADIEFLLPALFSSIIVPEGVMKEISVHEEDDVANRIRSRSEFTICSVALEPLVQAWDLGKGETDVISFAYHDPTHLPVLDDTAAKACCRAFGLRTLGTGAILLLGKQGGLLSSVREPLEMMRTKGMWIADSVIDLLCKKAGEK